MKIKGYLISSSSENNINRIIDRIKYMGKEYYLFRKCFPVYVVDYKGKHKILFKSNENLLELMWLLGFSFEGLLTDEEKISEIEQYGKYKCSVEKLYKIPQDLVIISELFK